MDSSSYVVLSLPDIYDRKTVLGRLWNAGLLALSDKNLQLKIYPKRTIVNVHIEDHIQEIRLYQPILSLRQIGVVLCGLTKLLHKKYEYLSKDVEQLIWKFSQVKDSSQVGVTTKVCPKSRKRPASTSCIQKSNQDLQDFNEDTHLRWISKSMSDIKRPKHVVEEHQLTLCDWNCEGPNTRFLNDNMENLLDINQPGIEEPFVQNSSQSLLEDVSSGSLESIQIPEIPHCSENVPKSKTSFKFLFDAHILMDSKKCTECENSILFSTPKCENSYLFSPQLYYHRITDIQQNSSEWRDNLNQCMHAGLNLKRKRASTQNASEKYDMEKQTRMRLSLLSTDSFEVNRGVRIRSNNGSTFPGSQFQNTTDMEGVFAMPENFNSTTSIGTLSNISDVDYFERLRTIVRHPESNEFFAHKHQMLKNRRLSQSTQSSDDWLQRISEEKNLNRNSTGSIRRPPTSLSRILQGFKCALPPIGSADCPEEHFYSSSTISQSYNMTTWKIKRFLEEVLPPNTSHTAYSTEHSFSNVIPVSKVDRLTASSVFYNILVLCSHSEIRVYSDTSGMQFSMAKVSEAFVSSVHEDASKSCGSATSLYSNPLPALSALRVAS